MIEEIILVDEKDNEVGYEEKIKAHEKGGKLHRAFSIFIFNSNGEMLLQQRSKKKHHFGELWTNTCCSHPRKGENLEDAVHRRLKEEFGFDAGLKEIFSFVYHETDKKSGLSEYEFDHVFIGTFDGSPKPNPDEIDDYKWIYPDKLKSDIRKNPMNYTPWFKIALEKFPEKYN